MTPVLEMAAVTHPGRVRSHNEDCVAADAQGGLAVLADGMGGHQAGEVASRMAVDLITSALAGSSAPKRPLDTKAVESLVSGQIALANAAILEAAHGEPRYSGMGTTVVVALWHDTMVSVAHVGDSRLYRLRGSRLEQLTMDHSIVQEQLERGAITREQARHAANRNVLTRAVGTDPELVTEVHSHAVSAGDLYLICSDGLTDMLNDEAIERVLVSCGRELSAAAGALVRQATASGGLDNISVILARVVSAGRENGR